MTATRAVLVVRIPAKSGLTKDARAMYDGYICAVDPGVEPDTNGYISVTFTEGPLAGESRWIKPEWLAMWRSEPSTAGEA